MAESKACQIVLQAIDLDMMDFWISDDENNGRKVPPSRSDLNHAMIILAGYALQNWRRSEAF